MRFLMQSTQVIKWKDGQEDDAQTGEIGNTVADGLGICFAKFVTHGDVLVPQGFEDGHGHQSQATGAHHHDPVVWCAGQELLNGTVGGESRARQNGRKTRFNAACIDQILGVGDQDLGGVTARALDADVLGLLAPIVLATQVQHFASVSY